MIRKTVEKLYNKSIRAEQILHLGTQCFEWVEDVLDTIDDNWEEVFAALGIEEESDDLVDTRELVTDYINSNDQFGFLVQFATPVPRNVSESSFSFSWGYYAVKWIYADDFESACEQAIKWRDEYIERCRNKFEQGR